MERPTMIITGASRGLGAATAYIAASLGANVVLTARSAAALEEQAGMIRAAGGQALAVSGDISRADDCRRVVEAALERFESLHALINNGGIIEPIAPVAEVDPTAWQQNWAVNLLGPVLLVQMALPYLRPAQGRVINVSSGAAVRPIAGWGAYSTAKAAINHFTKILAAEEPAITALAIRPGVIDTSMQAAIREQGKAGMPESEHQRFVDLHEQGNLLAPQAPGKALAYLALYAPSAWSGEFIQWDEPRVQQLIESQTSATNL